MLETIVNVGASVIVMAVLGITVMAVVNIVTRLLGRKP